MTTCDEIETYRPSSLARLTRLLLFLLMQGVAVILGVDTLMDMCRTSVNLLGNCLATAVVARWEGVDLSAAPASSVLSTEEATLGL